MKKNNLFVLFCLTGISVLYSCKKDSNNGPDEIPGADPVVTDKGAALGAAKTASIGTSGGTLTSDDGRLTITIPAGAFSATTTVGIQPLSNNSPMGLGNAYRITPEGTTFAKPVTLTFNYDDALLGKVVEDFLWITSQQADGTWVGYRKSDVNTTGNTVSVQATHFSDWSMARFIDLALNPAATVVTVNKSVALVVTGFLKEEDAEELVPLTPISSTQIPVNQLDAAIARTERYLAFKITGWSLNGSDAPVSNSNGKLAANGESAIYTAPSKIPNPNKVTVSVSLETTKNDNTKSKYLLLSEIAITEGNYYLHLNVDGTDYYYAQYGLNGQVPADPNVYQVVNCGQGTNGELMIAGSYVDGSFFSNILTLAIDKPAAGSRLFQCFYAQQSSNDELTFIKYAADPTLMRNQYVKREVKQGVCEETNLCSTIAIKLSKYSGQVASEVEGEFTGDLYLDLPAFKNQCQSSEKHHVYGDFKLVKVN
ncbi:MAG: hypothetical protein QM731_21890 [Chitinophagaceae bacterium]